MICEGNKATYSLVNADMETRQVIIGNAWENLTNETLGAMCMTQVAHEK